MKRFALLIAALTLGGCTRKAPGPFECQHFAETVLGAEHGDPRLTHAAARRLDDLTTQCLTTPYDHQLIKCIETTGRGHACLVAFHQRTGRAVPEL